VRTADVVLHSSPLARLPRSIELAATLYLPDRDRRNPQPRSPGLVVGHGAGSCRGSHHEFCREACAQGFAVLALDFRGHGDSAGAADGPLEEDVFAATEFLRGHEEVDPRTICYRGSSMGGFYGLKAAPRAGFAALALLCPASETVILDALAEVEDGSSYTEAPGAPAAEPTGAASYVATPLAQEPPRTTRWDIPRLKAYFTEQDSLGLAECVEVPVLLVHARADAVVPFAHSLALAGRLRGDATLLALAGGSHTSAQHDRAIHRLTGQWLLDHLASLRSACTGRT
jgi:dipeptidyl aminopeptidase/acylaminoacyl peptidase